MVGNQPLMLAGVLDIESSEKAARFVRTCDAFNIPLVTFVDVPGFLPGVDQEYGGIIRHGAKLLYAYCEATVPRNPDHHPQGLRRRVRRHEQQVDRRRPRYAGRPPSWRSWVLRAPSRSSTDASCSRPPTTVARRAEGSPSTPRKYANPYAAAERGYVDDVIDPAETRVKIIAGLEMLRTKREELPRRKHGKHAAVSEVHSITPTPTDEEAVAITAATEALWPKPVVFVGGEERSPSRAWRFSGRWWSRLPQRRGPAVLLTSFAFRA